MLGSVVLSVSVEVEVGEEEETKVVDTAEEWCLTNRVLRHSS